jgi:hypothetical protein
MANTLNCHAVVKSKCYICRPLKHSHQEDQILDGTTDEVATLLLFFRGVSAGTRGGVGR